MLQKGLFSILSLWGSDCHQPVFQTQRHVEEWLQPSSAQASWSGGKARSCGRRWKTARGSQFSWPDVTTWAGPYGLLHSALAELALSFSSLLQFVIFATSYLSEVRTSFYSGSSGSQLWDVLTASLSTRKEHKLHLFLFLRLHVQTTWDSLSFFHLITWLTITTGSCVKGYCSILAPNYSRAQDYIHWHGLWVCTPEEGIPLSKGWCNTDSCTQTDLKTETDGECWLSALTDRLGRGNNMPARSPHSGQQNTHSSNTQLCYSTQAPFRNKGF